MVKLSSPEVSVVSRAAAPRMYSPVPFRLALMKRSKPYPRWFSLMSTDPGEWSMPPCPDTRGEIQEGWVPSKQR